MIAGTQAVTGAAAALGALAILKVGAGAEAAPLAGEQQAAGAIARMSDVLQRVGEIQQHLAADRIHYLGMIEFEHGHLAHELQRHSFHWFPQSESATDLSICDGSGTITNPMARLKPGGRNPTWTIS
jgi:hypothetical protein